MSDCTPADTGLACAQPEAVPALTLLGPTASGKTGLAIALAERLPVEMVSVDSRQIYRKLDIGTGKEPDRYGRHRIHLIDVVDPGEAYSLYDFLRDCSGVIKNIRQRQALPLLVGGTPLYMDALLQGYSLASVPVNPARQAALAMLDDQTLVDRLRGLRALHNTTDLRDRARLIRAVEIAEASGPGSEVVQVRLKPWIVGLRLSGSALRCAITQRLEARFAAGLLDEVAQLLSDDVPASWLEQLGLEYRYCTRYLKGSLSRSVLSTTLENEIYRFARQQNKWFRRMERRGMQIQWLDVLEPSAAEQRSLPAGQLATRSPIALADTLLGDKAFQIWWDKVAKAPRDGNARGGTTDHAAAGYWPRG